MDRAGRYDSIAINIDTRRRISCPGRSPITMYIIGVENRVAIKGERSRRDFRCTLFVSTPGKVRRRCRRLHEYVSRRRAVVGLFFGRRFRRHLRRKYARYFF